MSAGALLGQIQPRLQEAGAGGPRQSPHVQGLNAPAPPDHISEAGGLLRFSHSPGSCQGTDRDRLGPGLAQGVAGMRSGLLSTGTETFCKASKPVSRRSYTDLSKTKVRTDGVWVGGSREPSTAGGKC